MMFDIHENGLVFVRMDDGEDFYEVLSEILDKYNVESGIILGGIGMLRDFTIGWFNGKEYEKETISTPHELVSLNGNVSILENGERFTHLHAALAGPDRKLVGGHLFGGTVNNTVEMFIYILEDVQLRRIQKGSFRFLYGRYR